jgi:hypothetical protein
MTAATSTIATFLCVLAAIDATAQQSNTPFDQMRQVRREEFFKASPKDACSELLRRVGKKEVKLDTSSRQTLTKGLLDQLHVPVTSQLLVFSGTASQGAKVRSGNPRALYFNDEVYIGVVPEGFVEMIGVDPEFGPVWYSIEKVVRGVAPEAQRDTSCFGCHGSSSGVPSMFTRFVLPNEAGGRDDFLDSTEGHHAAFATRFAGYHVTSVAPLSHTKEGLITLRHAGKVAIKHIKVGERYDPSLHLTRTSDIVAHLLHAHQVGFVNLAAEINTYARDGRLRSPDVGKPDPEVLSAMVDKLVRYMLFADEAPLPEGGVTGHPDYLRDFASNRRPCKVGPSLKDLDLRTRMFKYRCSYMIYTRQWTDM